MIDNIEKNMVVMENNLCDKIEDYRRSSVEGHKAILDILGSMQKEQKESNGWKNKFMGALGVIMFVVFPIMSWALYQVVTIDDKIDQALSEAFTVGPYVEGN